jgi:succinoglycan biosynthesis protein ExoA
LNNATYLRDVADAFARSGADCLGRPQPLDVARATPVQRAIASARSSWLGHHPSSFIYSGREQFVPPHSVAVAYRRSVFEAIGLFDECFDACEDVELNHRVDRAGLRCFFTPRIQAHYHPRSSLTGLVKQMTRYGRGRARLLRKHPDTFTLAGFLPALFLLGLLAGAALSCFSPWLAVAYLGSLALYLTAVVTTSLHITWAARDPSLFPWLLLVFPAIHAGAGLGILQELAGRGQRRPVRA